MKKFIKKIKRFFSKKTKEYNFNESNPLGGDGERVDIVNGLKINFEKLDIYQKNHYKRYEFATQIIKQNEICGDFACGTGYGSIMLSKIASKVIGIDINTKVITEIKNRYRNIKNVSFSDKNLLELDYENFFDTIVSFETIEHFKEEDIHKLISLFSIALKPNGKLIFSTPYMQEQSEEAIKLGFHLTFLINETKIKEWLNIYGLEIEQIKYQNYDNHLIVENLEKKDFIVCIARKK